MSLPKGPTTTDYKCTACGTTWTAPNPGHCFKCDTGEHARAIDKLVDDIVWLCQRAISFYGNEDDPPYWSALGAVDTNEAMGELQLAGWFIACKLGDHYGEGCTGPEVYEALRLGHLNTDEEREVLVRKFLEKWGEDFDNAQ